MNNNRTVLRSCVGLTSFHYNRPRTLNFNASLS